MAKGAYFGAVGLMIIAFSAHAAQKPIVGSFVRAPATGSKIIAVGESGKASTGVISKTSFSVTPPDVSSRLYILKDGKIVGQLVQSKCQGSDKKPKSCKQAEVYTAFKAGKNLGKFEKSGLAYVAKRASVTAVVSSSKATASAYVPIGLATKGLPTSVSGRVARSMARVAALEVSSDSDKDGLIEGLDVDDNGNGVIDNYDSQSAAQPANSFKVFSNLKLELDQSLNLHATGLAQALVDSAMSRAQTLAIAVAGGAGETTELDCSGLSYCSSGGTGSSPPPSGPAFPGLAGGSFDSDGDGYGTITKGATGDFQLGTGASASAIGAGDTLIERIVGVDGIERQVPGVLNFVFTSTPAIKSLAVNSGAAQSIDYSIASGRLASLANCLQVPATGPVALTIVGWRPQRPGIAAAGEGAYVDLGNSKITIDIPNGPYLPGSGSGSAGPGNCKVSAYSESDANLAASGDGLQDSKGDVDADAANTYQFTVDVTTCLASSSSGSLAWNAGESLNLDLQFRSKDGDNAAQKICLRRASAS